MTKMLVDFHHSSLLRSLVLLFEDRLGIDVYRPIGLDWFTEGFWGINGQEDTAKQFLSLDQAYRPSDGTPPLNSLSINTQEPGVFVVAEPGGRDFHRAATLEFFKNNQFDFVVASIPEHVGMFTELISRYQPSCKLIVQVGNNWDLAQYQNLNVLASVSPRPVPSANVMFYHQEFDLEVFHSTPCLPTKNIYSFLNVIKEQGAGWIDYQQLKRELEKREFVVASFGGQNPDGSTEGPYETAEKMREAQFICHLKPSGDGFGHVIYNAYAVGRPVITRSSYYRGQLAEELMVPDTYVDLDVCLDVDEAVQTIIDITEDPEYLLSCGVRAAERFREVVDYAAEGTRIAAWLSDLKSVQVDSS